MYIAQIFNTVRYVMENLLQIEIPLDVSESFLDVSTFRHI